MAEYEVRGTGITTGRQRKRVYRASNEDQARQLALADGTSVELVTKLPPEPPSERQLEYANGIGLKFPNDISGAELSSLLTNYERRDKIATERHRKFAERYDVEFTKYTGKKTLFDKIQTKLIEEGNERDLLSWFTYRVYRQLVKGELNVPIESPDDSPIQLVVDAVIRDDDIIKSVQRYEGKDLIWFGKWTTPDGYIAEGGSVRTKAFNKVEELLITELGIIKPAPTPKTPKRQKLEDAPRNETSGCLGTFLVITAIPISIAITTLMDVI